MICTLNLSLCPTQKKEPKHDKLGWLYHSQSRCNILCSIHYPLEQSKKDQNCKLQFPWADYIPRHSLDFRAVFFNHGPFSVCEISKKKQVNKQKLKISISTTSFGTTSQQWTSFVLYIFWWSPSFFAKLDFSQAHKMKKNISKMRKSKKTIFQWPKLSRLLTTLPRHSPDFRTCLGLSFRALQFATFYTHS